MAKFDEKMTPERWRKIGSLFEQALKRNPDERRAFLHSACQDSSLVAEVLQLIDHHERPDHRLDPLLPVQQPLPEAKWLGRTLLHFRILEAVGRGGQGQVFLAEDTRLHRQVALKLLPEEARHDGAADQRFLREARSAAQFDHPFACSVFEAGEDGGIRFIAMEFVRGETLRQRLSNGPPPFEEALRWAQEAAEALDAAHKQGLVHRDLKPSNLMVTQSGHIKVMDFGLAKSVVLSEGGSEADLAESLTVPGTAIGTISYMSPEQLQGRALDKRSDIFALGLVLFELLTGRHPFGRGSPIETAGAILRDPAPALTHSVPGCPALLERTVQAMLVKNPEERLDSAGEVAERLASLAKNPSPHFGEAPSKAVEAEDHDPAGRGETQSRTGPISKRLLATAVVLAGALFLSYRILQVFVWPPQTSLRVAVPSPWIVGSNRPADEDSVRFAVLEAILDGMTRLRGMEVFSPAELGTSSRNPVEIERSMAADEVLESRVACEALDCRVSLHRLRRGRVLSVSTAVSWSAQAIDTLDGAAALRAQLQRIYSEFETMGPKLDVRPDDYRNYLLLKQKYDQGTVLSESDIASLEGMANTSPQWFPAYLLAAEGARARNWIDRGLRTVERAQILFPDEPSLLYSRFLMEANSNRLTQAEHTLDKLQEILAGGERLQKARQLLLEKRGKLHESLAMAKSIVRRWPSWKNFWQVASLERRLGYVDDAREHFHELLRKSPGNTYGLSSLANLETESGDLKEAERLYRSEALRGDMAEDWTNLCLVLYLLGRYPMAVSHCERALALEPENDVKYRFNLALAVWANGDTDRARQLCLELDQGLPEGEALDRSPQMQVTKAHCLAKLGRPLQALTWTERALVSREDPWVVYEGALVFALLYPQLRDYPQFNEQGEFRDRFLSLTKESLSRGRARHWFEVPEFRSFKADPDFQALLGKTPSREASFQR